MGKGGRDAYKKYSDRAARELSENRATREAFGELNSFFDSETDRKGVQNSIPKGQQRKDTPRTQGGLASKTFFFIMNQVAIVLAD